MTCANNLKEAIKFENWAKKIKQLTEIISKNNEIEYVREYCRNNEIRNMYGCSSIVDQIEKAPCCEALNCTVPSITSQLDQKFREMANETARNTFLANIAVLSIEYFQIYCLKDEINKATNVIRDERQFSRIEQDLPNIESDINSLISYSQKDISKLSESKKNKFYSEVNKRIAKINNKLSETRTKLSGIEINLGRVRTTLELKSKEAWLGVAKSGVNLLSNSVNLATYWPYLNPSNMILGVGGILGWIGVGALNAHAYKITQERLNELAAGFAKVDELRNTLDALQNRLDEFELTISK